MNPYLGLAVSYLFVFIVIGFSALLQKKHLLSDEGARKFVHIGASNWYLIAMLVFPIETNIWFVIAAPVSFIVLNYISYKKHIFKPIERKGNGNLGTVYFPIALLFLISISYYVLEKPFVGLLGMLVLGYGDGFAAIFGTKIKSKKLIFGKTVAGTLAMFTFSFLVALAIGLIYLPNYAFLMALSVAVVATLVEIFTPYGLDNLTVPIVSSAIVYVFGILL